MRRVIFFIGFLLAITIGLVFSDSLSAQNPIVNADQFQQKAVKSALKGAKQKSLEKKVDNIRFLDASDSAEGDCEKREKASRFINVSTDEAVK